MFDRVRRQAIVQDLVALKDLAMKINRDVAVETSKTVGPVVTAVKTAVKRKLFGVKSVSDIPELE